MSQPERPTPPPPGSVAEKVSHARRFIDAANRSVNEAAAVRRLVLALIELTDAVEQLDQERRP